MYRSTKGNIICNSQDHMRESIVLTITGKKKTNTGTNRGGCAERQSVVVVMCCFLNDMIYFSSCYNLKNNVDGRSMT